MLSLNVKDVTENHTLIVMLGQYLNTQGASGYIILINTSYLNIKVHTALSHTYPLVSLLIVQKAIIN